jgi:hypothetical protein
LAWREMAEDVRRKEDGEEVAATIYEVP